MSIAIPLIGGPKCGTEVAFSCLSKAPPTLNVAGGASKQMATYVLRARAVRPTEVVTEIPPGRVEYRFMGSGP